jgi:hypothetical protein
MKSQSLKRFSRLRRLVELERTVKYLNRDRGHTAILILLWLIFLGMGGCNIKIGF